MKVGRFLKCLREEEGYSQDEWAYIFGVSAAYVGRVERSKVTDIDLDLKRYLHSIQFKYDSEVLGSIICGLNDYQLQRETILTMAREHNIKRDNLVFQFV